MKKFWPLLLACALGLGASMLLSDKSDATTLRLRRMQNPRPDAGVADAG